MYIHDMTERDFAKVQALLPLRIDEARSERGNITIVDRNGKTFCRVPFDNGGSPTDHARAVTLVSVLNALTKV